MISARGPATGDIHACDAKPAAANAARIAGAAASAPAFAANQAHTLGPAPERLAPSAPWSSAAALTDAKRSDERRVGKECVSTRRSRLSLYHYKYNTLISPHNRTLTQLILPHLY